MDLKGCSVLKGDDARHFRSVKHRQMMFFRYAMAHGFSRLARSPRETCINEVAADRVIGPVMFLAVIIGRSVRTIQGRKILASLQEPSVQIWSAVLGIVVVDTVLPVGLPVIPCQELPRVMRSGRWIEDKNIEAHAMRPTPESSRLEAGRRHALA